MITNRFTLLILSTLLALAGLVPLTAPAAAQDDCTFTASEVVPLYAAPLAEPAQITGALPGDIQVAATVRSGLTFDALIYVQLDDAYGGWVDPRSGTLNGDCAGLPLDARPLADYPSICTITTDQALAFYDDAALSTPKPFDLEPGRYVITRKTERAYFVRLDHAMGGWIAAGDGALSPACALLIDPSELTALTGANTRVWSAPSVRTGEPRYTLPEGVTVAVIAGPVRGPIRFDSDLQDDWYQVAQGGETLGWVWAGRLTFLDGAPEANGTALANARLWSLPDVQTGSQLVSLPPGTRLIVLEGPVQGRIRYDTDATGDWYRVQVAGSAVTGWLWAGRIALD